MAVSFPSIHVPEHVMALIFAYANDASPRVIWDGDSMRIPKLWTDEPIRFPLNDVLVIHSLGMMYMADDRWPEGMLVDFRAGWPVEIGPLQAPKAHPGYFFEPRTLTANTVRGHELVSLQIWCNYEYLVCIHDLTSGSVVDSFVFSHSTLRFVDPESQVVSPCGRYLALMGLHYNLLYMTFVKIDLETHAIVEERTWTPGQRVKGMMNGMYILGKDYRSIKCFDPWTGIESSFSLTNAGRLHDREIQLVSVIPGKRIIFESDPDHYKVYSCATHSSKPLYEGPDENEAVRHMVEIPGPYRLPILDFQDQFVVRPIMIKINEELSKFAFSQLHPLLARLLETHRRQRERRVQQRVDLTLSKCCRVL